MKTLSRAAVVLAFAVALLCALPAQAAPIHRTHATPVRNSLAARLGSAWTELTRFFAAATAQPATGRSLSTDGGSCIDPNGGCTTAQLFRP